MLLADIKTIFRKELEAYYPKQEIDTFFQLVIEHYLQLDRFALVMQPNLAITKEEEQPLFEALVQLKEEKPIQYILGEAHFMDLKLKVDENVLIPRPETEELVAWILDTERSRSVVSTSLNDRRVRILDIGTGSGCIAIALAKHLPKAKIWAMDISEKALAVASGNAEQNNVEIDFVQMDVLNWENMGVEFDIIVSNPPYVRELEKEEIKNNVKKYEPHGALFVSDDDPLLFYETIVQFSKTHLKPKGKLFFEVNQYLGEETKQLLEQHNFTAIELKKDIFGNDRMLKALNVPLRGL